LLASSTLLMMTVRTIEVLRLLPSRSNCVCGIWSDVSSESGPETAYSGITSVDGTTIVFDPTLVLPAFTSFTGVFTVFDLAGNKTTLVVNFTTGSSTF
jgi:hypothetical protein